MTAQPRTAAQLARLAGELPARYTIPLAHLARARVLTGGQLDQLLESDAEGEARSERSETVSRVRRRIMHRLGSVGLVATMTRRIGGVRAGSAGHVYVLTSTGYRFLALHNGQSIPPRMRRVRAPGAAFLDHALAISELYVQLAESADAGGFRLGGFVTEPATWWPAGQGRWLRPDAYAVLRLDAHADCWWIEVDNSTENLSRLRAKIAAYQQFFIHAGVGPDGVPPRVLFTAPETTRAAAIRQAIVRESTAESDLVLAATHDQAVCLMIAELREP